MNDVAFLLDVNTLVALAWPNHVDHERSRRWFRVDGMTNWCTNAIVRAGFVRVSMNHRVTGTDVSFSSARKLLSHLLQTGNHGNAETIPSLTEWPEWLTTRIQGYRQVTDAQLLACSENAGLRLATLDSGILDLVDDEHRSTVHVIPV